MISKLEKLKEIEKELTYIIHKDRQNWLRAAKLLIKIEKEKLYELRANSFTQYVKNLAHQNNINVSTLWRAKSAATFYARLIGVETVDEINERQIKTTPEQLEYLAKVKTIAPSQIIEKVQSRMLEGESIRNELKQLWETYKPLKHGKTERGRKPKNSFDNQKIRYINPSQFYLPYQAQDSETNLEIQQKIYQYTLQDNIKLHKYAASSEELTEANILNALLSSRWVNLTLKRLKLHRFQSFVKIPVKFENVQYKKLDVVAIAQATENEENEFPRIVGATIRSNLQAIEFDSKLEQASRFSEFHYLAIPNSNLMIEKAKSVIPEHIGIIAITHQTEFIRHLIKIIRFPKKQIVQESQLSELMSALLKKSLKWF